MRSLFRLFELLRITEQYDVVGGSRHRQHVGERHLARFVREKNVH
jgi:hypothetical protein